MQDKVLTLINHGNGVIELLASDAIVYSSAGIARRAVTDLKKKRNRIHFVSILKWARDEDDIDIVIVSNQIPKIGGHMSNILEVLAWSKDLSQPGTSLKL